MISFKQLISYKEDSHDLFGNSYRFVILNAENDLISKLNGQDRVAHTLSNYDNEAKALFYYQLKEISSTNDIILEIDECFKKMNDFNLSDIKGSRIEFIKSNVEASSVFQ